jgi:hypothetical protein
LYKRADLGTPPYARHTLIAVILYAMFKGYFGAQAIIKFAEDSIGIAWIMNGMKMPSYKTVERTINTFMIPLRKPTFEKIFSSQKFKIRFEIHKVFNFFVFFRFLPTFYTKLFKNHLFFS